MPRTAHLHQHLHLQLYTFVYPLVCVLCVFFHSISKLLPIQQHHHHHQHHQHHHHHNNWTLSIVFKCLPRPFPNQIDDPSLFLCLKINADERSSRAGEAGFATYLSSSRAREPAEPASLLPPCQTGGTDSARSRDGQSTPGDRAGLPPSPPLGEEPECYPSPLFCECIAKVTQK